MVRRAVSAMPLHTVLAMPIVIIGTGATHGVVPGTAMVRTAHVTAIAASILSPV